MNDDAGGKSALSDGLGLDGSKTGVKQKLGLMGLFTQPGGVTPEFLNILRNRSVVNHFITSRFLEAMLGGSGGLAQRTGRGVRKNAKARKALTAAGRKDAIIVPKVDTPATTYWLKA